MYCFSAITENGSEMAGSGADHRANLGERREFGTDLGRAIRARRRRLQLTQRDVAMLAGVNPEFVVEVERGKTTVRLATLVALLSVLGLRLLLEDGVGGLAVDEGVRP